MSPSHGSRSDDPRARADVAGFLASTHALPFHSDREGAGEVARTFLDVCYGTLGIRPDLLDEELLREALLELLPPRLDPRARSSRNAIAIVQALLDHFFETRPNANGWKLAAIFEEAASAFPDRLAAGGGREIAPDPTPITRPGSKLGRNDPCPCGSGKKFKKCCGSGG